MARQQGHKATYFTLPLAGTVVQIAARDNYRTGLFIAPASFGKQQYGPDSAGAPQAIFNAVNNASTGQQYTIQANGRAVQESWSAVSASGANETIMVIETFLSFDGPPGELQKDTETQGAFRPESELAPSVIKPRKVAGGY